MPEKPEFSNEKCISANTRQIAQYPVLTGVCKTWAVSVPRNRERVAEKIPNSGLNQSKP